MSDLVERLRYWSTYCGDEYLHELAGKAAARIAQLEAEVKVWQGHAKTAIWSDSEECKLLTADNERLRAEVAELKSQCEERDWLFNEGGEESVAAMEQELIALRATIERLRAALKWINHQRYTGRSTINPANGYDRAVALNTKLLAVMDVARGTLAQQKPNE